MSVIIQSDQLRTMTLGAKVDRPAAALPQTATGALFNVTGGRVLVTSIVGEVTTVLGATATNAKLVSTPTTGTAVDLTAVLAVANKEVGTLFGMTGLFSDALVGANAGAGVAPRNGVVIPVGSIGLNTTANNTGQVKWSITYIPLDNGAAVAAA